MLNAQKKPISVLEKLNKQNGRGQHPNLTVSQKKRDNTESKLSH